MLIPNKSEHQINTSSSIDPNSLAMLGLLILLLMVADKGLDKLIFK
jgi:hypothetical protein